MNGGRFRLKPIEVNAIQLDGDAVVPMQGSSAMGHRGDWVVEVGDKLELFPDEEFRKAFDPVDEQAEKLLSFLQPKEAP